MTLTNLLVKRAKPKDKDYKLSDGKGLFLLVAKNGSKYWRMKYRYLRKEKLFSIGVYPEISLKEARVQCDDARRLLHEGIDPSAEKRARKQALLTAEINSFKAVAEEWFGIKSQEYSKSHSKKVKSRLENLIYPDIGKNPTSSLKTEQILTLLRKVEESGRIETAHRLKQLISQVMRYAVITNRASHDPAAYLSGALKKPNKKHFAAITEPSQVGRLMLAIDSYQGTTVVCAALKLSALIFCRPGELRKLEWGDIDWHKRRIELPAKRMKSGEPHIIPLSRQAYSTLEQIQRLTGHSRYVFPSARGWARPMSENGIRTALRTLQYENSQMTAHGFRAMARTLLDEELNYRVDWIEHQLAHAVRDSNGRAYNRTKHLKKRTEMMQDWADYLDYLREHAAKKAMQTLTPIFLNSKTKLAS